MTNELILGRVLMLSASIFALLAALRYTLLPTLFDEFRQELFEARYKLFVLVAEGRVRPDEPAYTTLRTSINGLLRFAERITLLRALLSTAVIDLRDVSDHIESETSAVQDADTRSRLVACHDEVSNSILRHFIRTSPLLWLAVVVAWILGRVLHASGLLMRLLRRPILSIEAEAKVATQEFQAA